MASSHHITLDQARQPQWHTLLLPIERRLLLWKKQKAPAKPARESYQAPGSSNGLFSDLVCQNRCFGSLPLMLEHEQT